MTSVSDMGLVLIQRILGLIETRIATSLEYGPWRVLLSVEWEPILHQQYYPWRSDWTVRNRMLDIDRVTDIKVSNSLRDWAIELLRA